MLAPNPLQRKFFYGVITCLLSSRMSITQLDVVMNVKGMPLVQRPQADLILIREAWSFTQWGINLVGPFPTALGLFRFLLVAIDYFTKWVEAEPLVIVRRNRILKFVWKNIVWCYGVPIQIVSQNSTQFANDPLMPWCEELEIQQSFTSVAHSQVNG